MEAIYEFTAYNTETLYGYGSAEEAQTYLEWLNKNRDVNQYEMSESSISDEEGDYIAFNLREELLDLDLIECGDN